MGNNPSTSIAVEVLQPQKIPLSRGDVFVLLLPSDGTAHRITNFPSTVTIDSDNTHLEVRICTADDEDLFTRNVYDHFSSVFIPIQQVFADENPLLSARSANFYAQDSAKLVACWCGIEEGKTTMPPTIDGMVRQFELAKLTAGKLQLPKVGVSLQIVEDKSKEHMCGTAPIQEVSKHCSESVRHLQHVVQSLHQVDAGDGEGASSDVLEREIAVLRSSNQSLRKQYEVEISYLMSLLKTRNGGSNANTPRKSPRGNNEVGGDIATVNSNNNKNLETENDRLFSKLNGMEEDLFRESHAKEEALKLLHEKVTEERWYKIRLENLERERPIRHSLRSPQP